jgi:hypothetical protein
LRGDAATLSITASASVQIRALGVSAHLNDEKISSNQQAERCELSR